MCNMPYANYKAIDEPTHSGSLAERFRAVNTSNSSYSSNKSNSKSCLSTHAQTLGSTRLQ